MGILQISRMFQVYSLHYVLLSTDVAERIARTFNRSCAGQVVACHIQRLYRVRYTSPLHKSRSCGILYWVFGLILSFFSSRQLRVVLVGNPSNKFGVNVGVPQGSICLVVLFFYCALMIFIIILFLILLFMLTIILSAPNHPTFQAVLEVAC